LACRQNKLDGGEGFLPSLTNALRCETQGVELVSPGDRAVLSVDLPPFPQRHFLRISPQSYRPLSRFVLYPLQHRIPRELLPMIYRGQVSHT
jgi:hypothetical protein